MTPLYFPLWSLGGEQVEANPRKEDAHAEYLLVLGLFLFGISTAIFLFGGLPTLETVPPTYQFHEIKIRKTPFK